MGNIAKRRILKSYTDYRIKQYCIKECEVCFLDRKTGEAFCYGHFEKDGKYINGAGIDCDKIIDFCFDEKVKKASFWQ